MDLPHTTENELSNESKTTSLAVLVAKLWTSNVDEHLAQHY